MATIEAIEEAEILSEREFAVGDVTCECGRGFYLWWNGGELDEHQCECGLFYRTEHRSTVLTIRRP